MKPTKQMLKDMALLSRAKEMINPDEQFRLIIPGGTTLNTTGHELLKTADLFSELLNASANGNEKNISKAAVDIMEGGISARH